MKNRKLLWLIPISIFLYVYAWFWSNYYFQSPIKSIQWRCLLCRRPPIEEKRQEGGKSGQISYSTSNVLAKENTKPKTDIEIIEAQPHSEILIRVYTLESSRGKNDGCKSHGQFNGYGYGQNLSVWNCFDSFEIVTSKVNNWFDKHLKMGYSLDEALCYYNTGIRQPMCNYSMKYHSL